MIFNSPKQKVFRYFSTFYFMIAFYTCDALRLYLERVYKMSLDRFFFWVVPTFFFVIFILHKNPFDYLKLRNHVKTGVFWGIAISAIHALIFYSYWLWKGTEINFNLGFGVYWGRIIMAGINEEIVFRGLVLQNLQETYSFGRSNVISSFLFVIAHLPYWYVWGRFSGPLMPVIYDVIFLFAMGLFWGFLVKKTNSLWSSIIHHSVNNLLVLSIWRP